MMQITTSWDDGHPADLRLAEMLQKYRVSGTFYIPQTNPEREVIGEKAIKDLAAGFEIGGHTLTHCRIARASIPLFEKEILGSYQWLSETLGQAPVSFCFPGGRFNRQALTYAFKTGFQVVRTTHLLHTNPFAADGTTPTTLQVFPHSRFTYCKHLLKRFDFRTLGVYMGAKNSAGLLSLLDFFLERTMAQGGCLHLWGHSWEIEQHRFWGDLEWMLQRISGIPNAVYLQNRELLNWK